MNSTQIRKRNQSRRQELEWEMEITFAKCVVIFIRILTEYVFVFILLCHGVKVLFKTGIYLVGWCIRIRGKDWGKKWEKGANRTDCEFIYGGWWMLHLENEEIIK